MRDAFGVERGREVVSKWTEIKGKDGKVGMSGGYYGDYKAGGKTYPVLRYRNHATGQDHYVLPSDMPREGFKTSMVKPQKAGPNASRFASQGVSKAFTIGDDKRVRAAKFKERQSGLNTDLAGAATAAGASHAAIGSYNRWAEKYPNLRQLKAPGAGALTNTRVLKPVQLAQTAGSNLPGKAGRIVSHPALLGGTVVAVGVPLTIANHRQHNRDEKRVHRLEVRYPKRKKEKS